MDSDEGNRKSLRKLASEKGRSFDYVERIQGLRLIDDTFFNAFMEDNTKDMELFLRIILKDPALKVDHIQTQREVSNIFGRSVRFDVFTRNADGTICNTEVQRTDAEATPERARFNACMMDTLTIKAGFEWGKDHLPPTNVIFITENDPLGGGMPIYHIPRVILEMNGKRFDDKAGIIYVNAGCQDDKTELGRLMHDMFCERWEDMYHQELAERTRYLKTDEHGVMKMCKIMEEIREDGRTEGRDEANQNTILNLVKKGVGVQFMADVTGWTIEQVNHFLRSQNLQPAQ